MPTSFEELKDSLISECETLSITCSSEDILYKMCTLCEEHCISAEDFTSTWLSFVMSKQIYCPPTIELLEQMNREVLRRQDNSLSNHKKQKKRAQKSFSEDYTRTSFADDEANEMLEMYTSPGVWVGKHETTPKPPIPKTPKRLKDVKGSPSINSKGSQRLLSPVDSPIGKCTPTSRYSTRTNSGNVLLSHGDTEKATWKGNKSRRCTIQHFDDTFALTKPYLYMDQQWQICLETWMHCLDDMTSQVEKAHGIEVSRNPHYSTSEDQTIVGTIVSDGGEKLHPTSLLLRTFVNHRQEELLLNVTGLEQYSFFSGQTVVIEATIHQRKAFVKKLYTGVVPPLPANVHNTKENHGSLQIVVAGAPFTTAEEVDYGPLRDLLLYVQEHAPDVLILIGPFVDRRQIGPTLLDTVANSLHSDRHTVVTYKDVFTLVMEFIEEKLENLHTQVVVVSSHRDAHHAHKVFPTPAYNHPIIKNVQYMPDPCVLDIDGLVVGVTSVDTLFHLGKEEISYPPGSSDRMSRLVRHLLLQQSFYPLKPSSPDVNLDVKHLESHCGFSTTPHLLILPSDLKHFVKDVDGCVCINPERLSKGSVGGTFARIQVDTGRLKESTVADSILLELMKV